MFRTMIYCNEWFSILKADYSNCYMYMYIIDQIHVCELVLIFVTFPGKAVHVQETPTCQIDVCYS